MTPIQPPTGPEDARAMTPIHPPTGPEDARAGVLIVDKPAGWTSHDVVARIRRLAGTRKVGHAGTLDPMATGVLVVGLGRGTRLLGHLALHDKAYRATIRLGQSTVTDDAEGESVDAVDASGVDETAIRAAMSALTGHLQQVPAAVSAVKVDGRRSYARVRAGEEVALTARSVHVSAFELQAVRRAGALVDLDVLVECSTGTYVRALARDLGRRLAVGGHLTALRRSRVGQFTEAEARTLDELDALATGGLPTLSLDVVASRAFPTYRISDELVADVCNGRRIDAALGASSGPVAVLGAPQGPVAVLTAAGQFLALYRRDGATARAVAVFVSA